MMKSIELREMGKDAGWKQRIDAGGCRGCKWLKRMMVNAESKVKNNANDPDDRREWLM